MDVLPEDVLVEVLRRVPPRDLAASCRRVCRAWRAAVDSRRLLLPHVLPHALAGVFSNYCDYDCPHFFARPMGAAGPRIDGTFRSVRRGGGRRSTWDTVLDHCNGLVLYCRWSDVCVCNPATRRWARLPPPAPPDAMWDSCAYLAFDPSVSLHYEVVLIPGVPEGTDEGLMEWPPSLYKLHVFSSTTQAWEERVFVREGEAAGTIAKARLDSVEPSLDIGPENRYAEYWRGALYVHCRGAYVMRLSLSDEKGLYYAAIRKYELRVWRLYESQEQLEWEDKVEETWDTVIDHCNGLVLYCRGSDVCVCNPATRRWARLPPPAPPDAMWDSCAYLAFDPSVSLHYEVVLIPDVPEGKEDDQEADKVPAR
ncbi:hypothetical protein ACP70R_014750 [Stipagrostis hirtigluma subsp. patula]